MGRSLNENKTDMHKEALVMHGAGVERMFIQESDPRSTIIGQKWFSFVDCLCALHHYEKSGGW